MSEGVSKDGKVERPPQLGLLGDAWPYGPGFLGRVVEAEHPGIFFIGEDLAVACPLDHAP